MLIRKVDVAGRVILPREMRDYIGVNHNGLVVLELQDDSIVIKKHKKRDHYETILKGQIRVVNELYEREIIDKDTFNKTSIKLEKELEYQRRLKRIGEK